MKKEQSRTVETAELRRRAEEQLKAKMTEADFSRTDDQTRRLVHELEVHQVELEIQNAELRLSRDELEAANMELEAFNYSVSHDLRRPLAVINSYCQAVQLICGDQLDQQCRGFIQEMYNGTLRMNQLIDTLLNFSFYNQVKMQLERVDLSRMAEEMARDLHLANPERRVRFRITPGIVVNGDSNLLRVALDNLIGNAWKYTCHREGALIDFGVRHSEGAPVFFVQDNGYGFAMAHADKLFIPFQRLPGAEEFRGHGIGLATADRIIRRHGGRLWAEGEPDKGAIFHFTLKADSQNYTAEPA